MKGDVVQNKKITIRGIIIITYIHSHNCRILQSIFLVMIKILKEICYRKLNGEIKKFQKDFKIKSLKKQKILTN